MKESGSMQNSSCNYRINKKKLTCIIMAVLFVFFILVFNNISVFASSGDTTLSVVYNQSTVYLSNPTCHELSKLSDGSSIPSGSIPVVISGDTYYYTPSNTENKELLRILSVYGTTALKTTDDADSAVYSYGGTYYTYDTDKFVKSAYKLTSASASDSGTIRKYEYDSGSGEYKFNYYKVSLNTDNLGKNNVTYSEAESGTSGSVSVSLTEDKTENVYYTYNQPTGWEEKANDYSTVVTEYNDKEVLDIQGRTNVDNGEVVSVEDKIFKNNNINVGNNKKNQGMYELPTNAFVYGGSIYNKGTIAKLTADFIDNRIRVYRIASGDSHNIHAFGGAIANLGVINDIKADFINNYIDVDSISLTQGGAVFSYGFEESVHIDNIEGNFISNRVVSQIQTSYGGAIGNYSVSGGSTTIKNINSNFISNSSKSTANNTGGGAIFQEALGSSTLSRIGGISGSFLGNYSESGTSTAFGGAIMNWSRGNGATSEIKNIASDFIGNYVSGVFKAHGGAMYNMSNQGNAVIGSVVGDFIGNYAKVLSNSDNATIEAHGGAIHNNYVSTESRANATIGNISGVFSKNYVLAVTSTNANLSAKGGAIYNSAVIGQNNGGIINTSFIDNYAIATSTGTQPETVDARGGAIYTNNDLTIVATDGYKSVISGNYVQTTKLSQTEKSNEAIYVDSTDAALTFNAENNGSFLIEDKINGASGYNLVFTGDNTGSVVVTDTISGVPNLTVSDNITLNYVMSNDNPYNSTSFNIVSVGDNATFNYLIDLDLDTRLSDSIISRGTTSSGLIMLSDINLLNYTGRDDLTNFVVQVLYSENTDLQLRLSEEQENKKYFVKQSTEPIEEDDQVTRNTKWTDQFQHHKRIGADIYAKTKLASSSDETLNDAVEVYYVYEGGTSEDTSLGDTLKLVNQSDLETRNFNADNSNSEYGVTADLGNTGAGTLNINGVRDDSIATLDLKGKQGFNLANENTNLNFNNVKVTSTSALVTVSSENTSIGVNNSIIDGNIVSDNEYSMSITGNSTFNGTVGQADAVFEDAAGTISMKEQTFKNASLATNSGTVNLKNGDIENYEILNLTSKSSALYDIDLNVTDKIADTITVSGTSSGVITINNINITNGAISDIPVDLTGSSYLVRILYTSDDNIKLALSDTAKEVLGTTVYTLNEETIDYKQTVEEVTPWEQDYYKEYDRVITTKGQFGLAQIDDDSKIVEGGENYNGIGVVYVPPKETEDTNERSQGDTLMVVNQADLDGRTFKTDESTAVYQLKDNLGETKSGVMNVYGASEVVVVPADPNDPDSFEMSEVQRSTIDFNGNNGFELVNDNTTLNFKNVKLTGAKNDNEARYVVYGTNENTTVSFDNVELIDNTYGVETAGNVEIKGNSSISSAVTAKNINISGNTAVSAPIKVTGEESVIYLDASDTIELNSKLSGVPKYNDDGEIVSYSKLNIENGIVNLNENAQVASLDTTIKDTTLNVSTENSLDGVNIQTQGTNTVNISNGSIGTMALNKLLLNGTLNTSLDVDLAQTKMDMITAETVDPNSTGVINVTKLNLLSSATSKKISIPFTNQNLSTYVHYTGEGTIAYSDIYKYKTSYNDNDGYFTFTRSSSGGGGDFNPSVLASQISALTGIYGAQLQTFNLAFQHSDYYMDKSYSMRMAEKNENKYAFNTIVPAGMNYSPLMTKNDKAGFWIKPYAVFENVPLHNGPKTSNINYGTMIGYDTSLQRINHGFDRVFTYYISYNGSTQGFKGVDVYQNGGLVGFTTSLYRGNFFNATTVSLGATIGDASSKFGSETFTSMLAGVGNKLGYNFEFFEGRFIIQPSLLLTYSFIDTFNHKTSHNVKIKSEPFNILQVTPGLKFIGNLPSGWQPYIGVQFVWNIFINPEITANGVKLPEMYINPYIQYGFGVQKLFQDKFTLFCQAMVQNGGRNGVSVNGGMRWILGR